MYFNAGSVLWLLHLLLVFRLILMNLLLFIFLSNHLQDGFIGGPGDQGLDYGVHVVRANVLKFNLVSTGDV